MAPTHHHHHHHHHHKCCQIKQKLRRGLWSPQEDEKLMNHIKTYGPCSWSSVPQLAGLERCGKSCRLRWINYLRPNLKRGSFSPIEEQRIIELHSILGNKWSKIASFFPGRTDNEIKNLWNSSLKKRLESRSLKKQIGKEAANHTEITNHSYNDQSHHANDANQGSLITSPSPNHPPLKPIKSILHTPADHNAVKINPSLINFPFALQPSDQYYSPPIHSHAVFNHLINPAPNHAQAAANHVADGANELLIATDQASPPLITSLQAMAADHSHIIPNNNNTNDHVNDKWLMSSKHCYDNYPPLMDHSNNNHNNNNNNTNNYAMGKEGGSLMTWVYVNQAQLSLIRELNHHINQQSGSLIPFQEEDGYSPLIMGDDRVVSGGGGGRQGLWPGPGPGPGTARDCHAGSSGQSPTSTCTTAMGGGGDTSSSLPSLLDNCSEDDVNLWFGEQDEEEEELVGDILSFPHYS